MGIPATMHFDQLSEDVQDVVGSVAERLLEQGAKAVVLVGSHARDDAGPASDIDLFAVGDGPREHQERADRRVVSVHWFTPEMVRQRMQHPQSAVVAVAGWRDAVVVADPSGVAEELQREARAWSWDRIAAEADTWVVDELVGWAEYITKLGVALEEGRVLDAAAIRSETTLKIGRALAVHRRLVQESENGLWEAIADAGGGGWRRALEQALAVNGEDVRASAAGAVQLFALLVAECRERLDERERKIVDAALQSAEERQLLEAPR